MKKIETIRHSLAHIMALTIKALYPGVKFGIGPAIENGFYYDFDFREIKIPQPKFQSPNSKQTQNYNIHNIKPDDLPEIEKRMREIIKKNLKFKKRIVTKEKAKEIFKDQLYKLELIEELPEKNISIYELGGFIDLCAGPHVKSTKEIPAEAFKLTKIAGAYWQGDEKNPMLTRIYGLAFLAKKELKDYLNILQEAEKRDHRALGQRLKLFSIDEKIGTGLILWHPNGAILKRIIENYALNEYLKNSYQLVSTPHIAKLSLWQTSGHTEFYKENMFPPIHMTEIDAQEKDEYQIKPMNCPFHISIYQSEIRSYKNLPLRYTELGTVYRYEKSGTLHGLTRVRGLTQDDAHIFCTPEQLSEELFLVMKLTFKILKDFGFKEFDVYLSTRPEKYVGEKKVWTKAENSLKYALEKMKINYYTDKGGGAFYGPKIDIKIKDALGREWQCTTIQVDFNLAERFDITYINQKGKKQQPIMIHRALLGSLERFIGVLIEYYAGAFPLWLAPEQIWIIPVGNRHKKYCQEIARTLQVSGFRFRVKDENETVSKKIREGELQKIPYLLVVGDEEIKKKSVRIRKRSKGDLGMVKLNKFIKNIEKESSKTK